MQLLPNLFNKRHCGMCCIVRLQIIWLVYRFAGIHSQTDHQTQTISSMTNMEPKMRDLIEKSNEIQYVGTARDISEDVEKKAPETRAVTAPAIKSLQGFANVVATEDYSVFTVRQKRMMIATASFASWIRYLRDRT